MNLLTELMKQRSFEINLVIDDLEVRFNVEYKTDFFTGSKFYFKLISEDTDQLL